MTPGHSDHPPGQMDPGKQPKRKTDPGEGGKLSDGGTDSNEQSCLSQDSSFLSSSCTKTPRSCGKGTSSLTDTSNFDEAVVDEHFLNEPEYDYSNEEWDRDF